MTTFTFVRHGETDWNLQRRIQGVTDIPLNDTGRAQARDTAEALAVREWDGIVASPLSRARETAEIIAARLGLDDLEIEPDLRERAYGEVEGLDHDQIVARFPDPLEPVPGRERRSAVVARVLPALQRLAEEHPGESWIVVSHGGVIGSLVRYITEKALPQQGQLIANGSAHDFVVEDGSVSMSEFNGSALDESVRRRAPLSLELTLPS
ncbi:histidine phosphatase family protein [Cnuibacter physcomitrellae]|uniref:histidine phosphatase family protein n=1 Tax=Cnuibacter physcomitrellae TaxID=1619308 RepID=UPI002175C8FD|nr:histidine phosphatase family protein [Cnuibacter physcomitrellae]MCS5496987.1 histidine phosphatase family protein [Cnuibacter physcomitrellae]